jgi:hypothetical protein
MIHLGILFYVMIKRVLLLCLKNKDPILKYKISALIAGMAGIMVASYGNAVLGQMPTALFMQRIYGGARKRTTKTDNFLCHGRRG